MWTLCQLPNCFLLFFVSGELFLPKSDFYETSELLCHKEAFQDECFLTLLYDEWKPVSLNKLKILPPRRQKSFFLCQKRSVSRNNVAKKRNRKSQIYERRQHVLQPSFSPAFVVVSNNLFVYHIKLHFMNLDLFRISASQKIFHKILLPPPPPPPLVASFAFCLACRHNVPPTAICSCCLLHIPPPPLAAGSLPMPHHMAYFARAARGRPAHLFLLFPFLFPETAPFLPFLLSRSQRWWILVTHRQARREQR